MSTLTLVKSGLNLRLEPSLRKKLDKHLANGELLVPHGAYTEFFSARIREFLDWETLDLAVYGLPAGYFVKGPPEMIANLRAELEGLLPFYKQDSRI